VRLYFLHMEGCPACEAAKPELERFRRSRMARGIEIVPLDLLKVKWTYPHWQAEATPTYVLEEIGFPRVQHVGGLTKERLDEFVQVAKNMTGMP
jgi:hypothetical protein